MTKTISPQTQQAILEAAWQLMSRRRRLDVGMAEVAAAAGVSRQAVFYAFGNRAGLLVAMARHKDAQSGQLERLAAIARGDGAGEATLLAFVDTWLAYLPEIYPVAVLLEAQALTDPDAALAWHDRFFVKGLRRGFELILGRMAAQGALPAGRDPAHLADLCLALVAPSAWRLLVSECGWSAAEFGASRRALVRAALAPRAAPDGTIDR